MKIKKQLVLFIAILISTLSISLAKSTEETILISKYLSKTKTSPMQLVIPPGSKAYNMNLIIFRDMEGPPSLVSREFKVTGIMNEMDIQFVLKDDKKFVEQRIWWNDFTYVDGKIVFRYADINYFISEPFKKVVSTFMNKMSYQINLKSLLFFKERCVYALRGRYMGSKKNYKDLDGKDFKKDPYQLYAFCFPEDTEGQIMMEFIKKFEDYYTHYMINIVDNLVDLQTFGPDDPKKFKYYTTDFDYLDNQKDNHDFLTGWGRVNEHGVLFTNTRVNFIYLYSL